MVHSFASNASCNNDSFLQVCLYDCACLHLGAYEHMYLYSVCVRFQCSVTCGQGKTTRQVLCVNFSDQEVNANECDPDDRPTTEQDCAMSQCPSHSSESRPFPSSPNTSTRNNLPRSQSHQWRTGPWGAVRHLTHGIIRSQRSTNPLLWGLTSEILCLILCNHRNPTTSLQLELLKAIIFMHTPCTMSFSFVSDFLSGIAIVTNDYQRSRLL